MSTRIEKDFLFQCGLHYEGSFHINCYDILLSFTVETNSFEDQNIAMERITYYLSDILHNTIIVDMSDRETIDMYKRANLKVCEVPGEPHDQIVGMIIIMKLNAIMEGRMKISDMVFGSSMSDGVRYSIVSEVAENLLSGKFWWNRSSICISGNDLKCPNSDNIVKLFDHSKWSDLDLRWKEKLKK